MGTSKATLQRMRARGLDEQGRPYFRIRASDPSRPGKRVTVDSGRWTPAEAQDRLEVVQARLTLKMTPSPDSGGVWRLHVAVESYLRHLARTRGSDHSYTLDETRRLVNALVELGDLTLDQISTVRLADYATTRSRQITRLGRPTSKLSIKDEIGATLRALRHVVDREGWSVTVPQRPTLHHLRDNKRPDRRLTPEEVAALIREATSVGLGELVTVLAWSGRRPVAVFAARVRDCSRLMSAELPREERLMYWRTDKGGVGRGWAPVVEPAYHALRAEAEDRPQGELLWGRQWRPNLFAGHFQRLARRAHVDDVQLYDLRRFACTQLAIALEGNLPSVRVYTGHSRDQTLSHYVYAPRGLAQAMASRIGWSRPELRALEGGGHATVDPAEDREQD